MNYTKPAVRSLGDAEHIIQFSGQTKPSSPEVDGSVYTNPIPAYDLDE